MIINKVTILGIPYDEASSFLRGSALAPRRVRDALLSGESNSSAESGRDLDQEPNLIDGGDLRIPNGEAALKEIEEQANARLQNGEAVLALGGDHSITYPLLRAYAGHFSNLSLIHFDAHSDTYDEFQGSRYSHACPFARIMEEGLVSRLVQIGIRTLTPYQRQQVARFGIEVVEMKDFSQEMVFDFQGPVYLSLDLDALDPAFAPGVSHHEPGGLSTREILRIIQRLDAPLVGADIVELNPVRDLAGITAAAAAKFVREISSKMLDSLPRRGEVG